MASIFLGFYMQRKINELQESLDSALSEKRAVTQELERHKNIIAELNDRQSKSSKIQSANEARIQEVESQLQEALQRHSEKESETKELNEKLNTLEGQIKSYEEQAREAVAISETHKAALEESHLKLKHLETVVEELQNKSLYHEKETAGLNEENSKLKQEIAIYESKLGDLQSKLTAALGEKDEAVREISTYKNAIEELATKHSSEVETLKSQISSAIDEKNLLNETNQNLKKEFQSLIFDLEEKLKEQQKNEDSLKSEVETLKAEIAEKSVLQIRLKEIEGQLIKAESRLSEEVGSVKVAASQREAELSSKLEDYAEKVNDINVLNGKVTELEKELQLSQATIANQISSAIDEKNLLNETNQNLKKELQSLIFDLEEKLKEQQKNEDSLKSEVETLKAEIAEKSVLQIRLTDLQSKSSKIQRANEARIQEVESQLKEALQRHSDKESETKELNEKLKQAREAVAISETHKAALEESHLKLKHLETVVEELQNKSLYHEKETAGLNEENSKLKQEIAIYESKLGDLQSKLTAALGEKDEAVREIFTYKNAIEELATKHSSEVETLKSQISSAIDEKNLLNETNQNLKKEFHSLIFDLEEKLKEQQKNEDSLKSEVETLKAEIAEKSVMQIRLKEIEGQLIKAESRLSEEVESVKVAASQREAELSSKLEDYAQKVNDINVLNGKVVELEKELQLSQATIANQKEAESQKLELEASLKNSLEELETKKKEISLLQKQVTDLEQKLQLGGEKFSLKGEEGVGQKDELEVKSRDIGSSISTPSKRKSKKKSEAPTAQTSSSSETHVHTDQANSLIMNFKLILGVALVSIIFGIILWKHY